MQQQPTLYKHKPRPNNFTGLPGHEDLPSSQVLADIKAVLLAELSNLHKDRIIVRSHNQPDLTGLSFVLDVQRSCSKPAQASFKKDLNMKISKLKGTIPLRYLPDKTDYVVVDQECFNNDPPTEFPLLLKLAQTFLGSTPSTPQMPWTSFLKQLAQKWVQSGDAELLGEMSSFVRYTEGNRLSVPTIQAYLQTDFNQLLTTASIFVFFAVIHALDRDGFFDNLEGASTSSRLSPKELASLFVTGSRNSYLEVQDQASQSRAKRQNAMLNNQRLIRGQPQLGQQYRSQQEELMGIPVSHLFKKQALDMVQRYRQEVRTIAQGQLAEFLELNSRQMNPSIISSSDLYLALEFMASSSAEWHNQRHMLIHQDYQKVNYNKQQHFVISKVDFNSEFNTAGRLQKYQQRSKLQEHEKQVYHEFEKLTDEVLGRRGTILPESYTSEFDVHRLRIETPKGYDPCQTFNETIYCVDKKDLILKCAERQVKMNKIKADSETEGVIHDLKSHITLPRPQKNFTYCQICTACYENFDDHVASDSHRCKATMQFQLQAVQDIMDSLNEEKRWLTKWKPEPKKQKTNLRYRVGRDNKIYPIGSKAEQQYLIDNFGNAGLVGKKSARASATLAGKESKTSIKASARASAKASARRISAKSSVVRSVQGLKDSQQKYQNPVLQDLHIKSKHDAWAHKRSAEKSAKKQSRKTTPVKKDFREAESPLYSRQTRPLPMRKLLDSEAKVSPKDFARKEESPKDMPPTINGMKTLEKQFPVFEDTIAEDKPRHFAPPPTEDRFSKQRDEVMHTPSQFALQASRKMNPESDAEPQFDHMEETLKIQRLLAEKEKELQAIKKRISETKANVQLPRPKTEAALSPTAAPKQQRTTYQDKVSCNLTQLASPKEGASSCKKSVSKSSYRPTAQIADSDDEIMITAPGLPVQPLPQQPTPTALSKSFKEDDQPMDSSDSDFRESVASGYENDSSEFIESETCNQMNKSSVSVDNDDSENSEIKQVMGRMHQTEGPMNMRLNNPVTEEPSEKDWAEGRQSQKDSFDQIDELISQIEFLSSTNSKEAKDHAMGEIENGMNLVPIQNDTIAEAEEEDNGETPMNERSPAQVGQTDNTDGCLVLSQVYQEESSASPRNAQTPQQSDSDFSYLEGEDPQVRDEEISIDTSNQKNPIQTQQQSVVLAEMEDESCHVVADTRLSQPLKVQTSQENLLNQPSIKKQLKDLKIQTSLREKSTKEQSGSFGTTVQPATQLMNDREEVAFPTENVSSPHERIMFSKQLSHRSINFDSEKITFGKHHPQKKQGTSQFKYSSHREPESAVHFSHKHQLQSRFGHRDSKTFLAGASKTSIPSSNGQASGQVSGSFNRDPELIKRLQRGPDFGLSMTKFESVSPRYDARAMVAQARKFHEGSASKSCLQQRSGSATKSQIQFSQNPSSSIPASSALKQAQPAPQAVMQMFKQPSKVKSSTHRSWLGSRGPAGARTRNMAPTQKQVIAPKTDGRKQMFPQKFPASSVQLQKRSLQEISGGVGASEANGGVKRLKG